MNEDKIKVLVIDDEADISYFTCKILDREGFQSFNAMDGEKALEIFSKERPQIVIIDVDLGYSKIDGMEVLEKIKETDKEVECIMVSRITETEIMARAKELGARYLNKPLDTRDWLKEVHNAAAIVRERK